MLRGDDHPSVGGGFVRSDAPLLICDLTQSYSRRGGGISTYLREKRNYVLEHTGHQLLQIVPGPEDRVVVEGRHIFAQVRAPQVPGSPNYRFILRTGQVRRLLAQFRPDIVESLCPWVLPWTAIAHRRAYPGTALVAGYRTDFPNAHIYRVGRTIVGDTLARGARTFAYRYAEKTYREFDWVYTLSETMRDWLGEIGIARSSVLNLGVDTAMFSPAARDAGYRTELGLPAEGPLLIYAGRIDYEKRADKLFEMFRSLPRELGASLVMIGDGKLREPLIEQSRGLPVAFPGFESNREALARALASSDIYVSAMADETFGISVIEAQACGLPVVGVASGAMPDRVPAGMGRLGEVDDIAAMAGHVAAVWHGGHDAMGAAARAMVLREFGWDRTFATLFEEIYPRALENAATRVKPAVAVGEPRGGRADARPNSWSTRPL